MNQLVSRTVGLVITLKKILHRVRSPTIAWPRYVASTPSPQTALDIMAGRWKSALPEPLSHYRAGNIPLFEDHRIKWLAEQVGGLEGQSILELGPLEGGHSYLLEKLGAARIVAVEADRYAYLKCLIIKELLDLKRVSFQCGDGVAYLREADCETYDLCLASGVLYHMQNPAELLALLAKHCLKHLFLWTHYYEETALAKRKKIWRRHTRQQQAEYGGFNYTLFRYEYQEGRFAAGFSGGTAEFSHWMSRADILRCLEYFGFAELRIGFDEPDHQHGPAFAVLASRRGDSERRG